MKRIYLDRRVWRNSRDNWVSFESDPKLRVTKTNIYGRCVPCITNLYQQLREGKEEIELKEAYHCWKVVAVLKDREECLEVLKGYEENFLGSLCERKVWIEHGLEIVKGLDVSHRR